YVASGAAMAGSVVASFDSGPRTKPCAALIGWVTPGILAGANSRLCEFADWLLYGGPWVAVSLVPFSSVAAVARKSAGASFTQVATVTGGALGEDSSPARPAVRASTITDAIVPSFRMS